MRKFSLFSSMLATGLLLGSCAAEVDLDEAAAVTATQQGLEKAGMYYTNESNNWLPISVQPNFVWGVNGHPITAHAYGHNLGVEDGVKTQLNKIKELGLNYYRVDVQTDANGNISNVDNKRDRFEYLLAQAKIRGIKILPMIYLEGLNHFATDLVAVKAKGKAVGEGFANTYKTDIDYYELGNEEENQVQKNPITGQNERIFYGGDGINPDEYNSTKMQILAEYYKGMTEGIKSRDSGAFTIINNAGWLHYGFFQKLLSYGVTFDIVGCHFYSDMGMLTDVNHGDGQHGDMINNLSNITGGKDVWITEINRIEGSYNSGYINAAYPDTYADKKQEQAKWIQNYIRDINGKTKVKAFFVHELYDQDYFTTSQSIAHSQLGIMEIHTPYTTPAPKPAFTTLKFYIEETKYGYSDYAYSIFKILNRINPDASQLSTWTTNLRNSGSKLSTVSSLMNDKAYEFFINELFVKLLGRNNTNTSVTEFFENRLISGATREEIITDFCHGDEFWQLSGSNNTGFVTRLYSKLLGTNPGQAVITQKAYSLSNGTTKGALINEILSSGAYIDKFIAEQYPLLHGRPILLQTEKDHWRNQMLGGLKQNDFIKTILCLNEVWEKSIIDGYNRRNNPTYTFE